jgi:pSer/pThr/pTyr-binding forkhead associated (FHA) protein
MNKIHLRIGGAKDNQLVIECVDIAPYHLELFCDSSGNVFITDLNSEQGTFVNNRRLNGFQLLKRGDLFLGGIYPCSIQ